MRSSIVLAATSAALAMGAAINRRVMETVLDVEYVTVTVTEGDVIPTPTPTPSAPAVFVEKFTKYETIIPIVSTIAPEPETPTPTPTPTPSPTPTPAPVVEPVVEPVTSAAPVSTVQAAPSPAPVESGTTGGAKDFQSTCVDTHNAHRANHSAPALAWDSTIAGYAAQLAETCVFEHDMTIGGGGYGQNLAMWGATGSETLGEGPAALKAIRDQWYNGELGLFNQYGVASPNMDDFKAWGHFTQLVWVGSTGVGCAVKYCAAGTLNAIGTWYTVCNYKSQGNVLGSFDKNVLPPGSAATLTSDS